MQLLLCCLVAAGGSPFDSSVCIFRHDFSGITGHAAIHAPIAATAVSIGDERVELLQNEQIK